MYIEEAARLKVFIVKLPTTSTRVACARVMTKTSRGSPGFEDHHAVDSLGYMAENGAGGNSCRSLISFWE